MKDFELVIDVVVSMYEPQTVSSSSSQMNEEAISAALRKSLPEIWFER